jgi:hypothetical protein
LGFVVDKVALEQYFSGYPGVKLPGLEADHLPAASVEIRKMRIYTSTPPYIFVA